MRLRRENAISASPFPLPTFFSLAITLFVLVSILSTTTLFSLKIAAKAMAVPRPEPQPPNMPMNNGGSDKPDGPPDAIVTLTITASLVLSGPAASPSPPPPPVFPSSSSIDQTPSEQEPDSQLKTFTIHVPLRNLNTVSIKISSPPMYIGATRLAPRGTSIRIERATYVNSSALTNVRCLFSLNAEYIDTDPMPLNEGQSLREPVEEVDMVLCTSSSSFFTT